MCFACACLAVLGMDQRARLRRGIRLRAPAPGMGRPHVPGKPGKNQTTPIRANIAEKAWQRAAPQGGRLEVGAHSLLNLSLCVLH